MSRLSCDIHPLFSQENLQSLFNAGIFSVTQFLKADIKKISASSNLLYKDIIYLKKIVVNKQSAVTRNGLKYYKEILTKSAIILTGINSLDKLLEGGLLTGQIYEICGLPSSGKTQLCMTIAKNAASTSKRIYYLDSKNDFSGKRFKQMLENTSNIHEEQIPEIMSNVLVKQIKCKYELISAMHSIKEEIVNNLCIRLIIIDSLPTLFHSNLSNYSETNGLLNELVNIVRFLAVECHLAVIITNILTTWYEGDFKTQSDSAYVEKVCLGKYWMTIPNVRLTMKKKGNSNKCTIYNYKYNFKQTDKIAQVCIGDGGVS